MGTAATAVGRCRPTFLLLLIVAVFWSGGLVKPATSQDTGSAVTTTDGSSQSTTAQPVTDNTPNTTANPNSATTTNASSTASSQATTTSPGETTAGVDYCASNPCVHGTCNNTRYGSYVCRCEGIWAGPNCEKLLGLWPADINSGGITSDNATASVDHPLSIPFSYFERVASSMIAFSNGYVTFNGDIDLSTAPIGTGWPQYPSILGVYWTPIRIPTKSTAKLQWLTEDDRLSNLNYNSTLIDYVKAVVNESNFEPLLIAVRTWWEVLPSKPINDSINDKATFQLILATDSQFSYAIKNYNTLWRDALTSVNGRPLVSADYSGENGTRMHESVPKSSTGPLLLKLFSSGTPTRGPLDCVQGTLDVAARLGGPPRACPCYLPQVPRDGWLEAMNSSSNCYQGILFPTGVREKCCYNRFGWLINDQTEQTLPIQVNASGITILSALDKCSTAAPNLRTWFFNKFMPPSCSSYKVPSIAGIIGNVHIVMFDNNKYTFNAMGDFVLFRYENIEVQARTRRIGNTNVTSLEAIAIKVGQNNGSFQLYSQTSGPVWNYFFGPGDTPSMSTYKIVQTESNITLLLPSFIVTVTNKSDVITCIIQTDILDPKSVGLLGSANGDPNNNFKFRDGTLLQSPVQNLSGENVRNFVLSWKTLNETESLFSYPGARPYAEVNNNTDFTPAPLATTVTATLNMYQDANKKMKAQQLCGDDLFCLQDYYLSDNNVTANEVLQQTKNFTLQKGESLVSPPKFNTPPAMDIISNLTTPFTTMLTVENNMAVEFSIDKDVFLNNSGITLNQNTIVWDFSSSLALLRSLVYPRRLRFYATNGAKLSTEYAPIIYLCLCEKANQCRKATVYYEPNNDGLERGNVNNVLCNCGDKSGGKFCDQKVDFCNNCFNNLTCNATNYYYCAPCPSGYAGDGKVCDDIDECSTNNGGCDQVCTNKIGSFDCSCRPGYTQNGTKCLDVDECKQDKDICKSQFKYCANLPGTYSCPCFSNLVGQDTCFKAANTFLGTIVLANTGNQTWNPRLTDKMSAEFQTLAGFVTKSVTKALNNTGVFNGSNLFVEVLAFEAVQPAARKRRDTAPSNNHTAVKFAINVANSSVMADTVNKLLQDFGNSTCNQSCQYGEIVLYSKPPQMDSNTSLCNYPQIHKCDELTSSCVQSQQTTDCVCKPGYEYSSEYLVCRDKNECAGNVSQICPNGGACTNTAGSYKCDCSAGFYWDANTTKCVVDGCSTKPCQNDGVCFTLHNPEQYVCRCTYGWEGNLCENEDAEAKRMEIAVICVSVILGVCCLVLFIILIIICVRHHRTLESDSYTNSRYNDGDHLPRAKISNRTGTEIGENGQNSDYQRLGYGQAGQNQTTFGRHSPTPNSKNEGRKSTYENRAYEGDGGERL